ncbi:MAG: Fmu (Sun) domain-containing protein [Ferruginibacter sp.]|nr:Fmu (Sun) domain-containing protein [Ferruginibacter sp.]
MSKYHSYLHTATQIIQAFHGEVPLAVYLKQYFSQHKKFGSKDRKALSALCYQYYRVAHISTGDVPFTICMGAFLCNHQPSAFLETHFPEWNAKIHGSAADKLLFLHLPANIPYPFRTHLSPQIEEPSFAASILKQPEVFLRVRPGKWKSVVKALQDAGIAYQTEPHDILRLPAAVKVHEVLHVNRDVVVQDIQSARVLEGLPAGVADGEIKDVWDGCAASGGKSILMYDFLKGRLRLTVTDIRKGILQKLKERLQQARVPVYHAAVADVTTPDHGIHSMFDIILYDAPCTGSGTWSRTPEQLYFFKEKDIEAYQHKQQQMVQNIWPQLKPGGYLVYITCSVFTAENEALVHYISQLNQAKLLQAQYFKGYDMRADTLFAAVWEKLL